MMIQKLTISQNLVKDIIMKSSPFVEYGNKLCLFHCLECVYR